MPDEAKSFTVENARIIFRNFEGKEDKYNTKGDRNFSVVLSPDVAEALAADGWNVRMLDPREEGDEPTPYVQIKVSYKNRPPRITMLTATSRTQLNEESIEVLDWVDVKSVDLIARGYDWVVGDKSGTKAYLQTMFITIEEDELERKYAINEPGNHA